MTGDATRKRRQCSEKTRYREEKDAREPLRIMRYKRLPGWEKLHIYYCSFCRGWHIGKDGKKREER